MSGEAGAWHTAGKNWRPAPHRRLGGMPERDLPYTMASPVQTTYQSNLLTAGYRLVAVVDVEPIVHAALPATAGNRVLTSSGLAHTFGRGERAIEPLSRCELYRNRNLITMEQRFERKFGFRAVLEKGSHETKPSTRNWVHVFVHDAHAHRAARAEVEGWLGDQLLAKAKACEKHLPPGSPGLSKHALTYVPLRGAAMSSTTPAFPQGGAQEGGRKDGVLAC